MGLVRHKILSDQLVGIILCGGKSSRMGRDKSRLILDGQTLLESTRERLAVVTEKVFTAGREDCDFVDTYRDKGPAMALFSMLEQAQPQDGARFLIMPVDMPLCTPACLQEVLDASLQRDKSIYTKHAVMPMVIRFTETGFTALQQCVRNRESNSPAMLICWRWITILITHWILTVSATAAAAIWIHLN